MAPALQDPEATSSGPTGPGQVSAASNSTCVPCTWSPCLPPLRRGPSVAGGNTPPQLEDCQARRHWEQGGRAEPEGWTERAAPWAGRPQAHGPQGGCRRPGPRAPQLFCTIVLVLPREEARLPMRQLPSQARASRGEPPSWAPGDTLPARLGLRVPRGHSASVPRPFSPGRRSTARWTRAPRPRAGRRPPTTTRSWACTTPKTTSLSERQVGAGCRGGVRATRRRGEGPPHPGSSG